MSVVLKIEESIESWEAVAAIELVFESNAAALLYEPDDDLNFELFSEAGVPAYKASTGGVLSYADVKPIRFARAYRKVDSSQGSYLKLLATESGIGGVQVPARAFRSRHGSENGSIVVVPWALRSDLELPDGIWVEIVRFLRSYGSVQLVGNSGQRLNGAALSESEILCDCPLSDKLDALAAAKLIVGVPNTWTMVAAAWTKRIALYYPETIPIDRWFWADSFEFSKMRYDPRHLNVPAALAGLRQVIARY